VIDIAWGPSIDHLYVVVGRGGLIDIEAVPVGLTDPDAPPQWHQVTRSLGPVAGPAVTRDGKELYYLALDPDGWDLRRLPLDAATEQLPELSLAPDLAPVAVGQPPPVAAPAMGELGSPQSYGWGRPEWQALVGGYGTNDGGPVELGVRVGDLVGRFEVLALGALGEPGDLRGVALVATSRRLPVELGVHAYDLREGRFANAALERERRGFEASAAYGVDHGRRRFGLRGGVVTEEAQDLERDRRFAFVEADGGLRLARGRWWLRPSAGLAATARLGGEDIPDLRRFEIGIALGSGNHRLELGWAHREADGGDQAPVDELATVGGAPSSLTPGAFDIGWGPNPALPRGALVGEQVESQHLRLSPAFLPVTLLAERHRADRGEWVELVGAEWRIGLDRMPLVRLPRLEARVGVAEILDGPLGRDTRWWAGLVVGR
jgi:hypothetical protein